MLRFYLHETRTGTHAWKYTGVLADAEGTGLVVAAPGVGIADTVRVRVLGGRSRVINTGNNPVSAGSDTTRVPFTTHTPCQQMSHPNMYSLADTVKIRFTNLTPGTITLLDADKLPHMGFSSALVVRKAPGTAMVVGTYRGGADTAVFTVQ